MERHVALLAATVASRQREALVVEDGGQARAHAGGEALAALHARAVDVVVDEGDPLAAKEQRGGVRGGRAVTTREPCRETGREAEPEQRARDAGAPARGDHDSSTGSRPANESPRASTAHETHSTSTPARAALLSARAYAGSMCRAGPNAETPERLFT